MFADHKWPLVQEHYETGRINKRRMRRVNAVQPSVLGVHIDRGLNLANTRVSSENVLKRTMSDPTEEQKVVCRRQKLNYVPSSADSKVGFAIETQGKVPINGLRHPPAGDTNGWYIWCGEVFLKIQISSLQCIQYIYWTAAPRFFLY